MDYSKVCIACFSEKPGLVERVCNPDFKPKNSSDCSKSNKIYKICRDCL